MSGKDLRQAVATFVQQLMGRVQPLLDEATSLEVSTYSVDAPQLESLVAMAAGGALPVPRRGYTRVTFHCDLNGCTEVERRDEVDAPVRPMHSVAVEQALAGRETLLTVGREALDRLRG